MSHDMGVMAMGGGADCKVSMLWNWYTIDACFLSNSWHIRSPGMFAASCIGVIFLTISLELLRRLGKEYDALTLRQFQRSLSLATASAKSPSQEVCEPCAIPVQQGYVTFRASPLQQLIRSLVHAVTMGVAYILMLLAMYFNGYIIFSIIIGAFIGKFFCDWLIVKLPVGGREDAGAKASAIDEPTVCCS